MAQWRRSSSLYIIVFYLMAVILSRVFERDKETKISRRVLKEVQLDIERINGSPRTSCFFPPVFTFKNNKLNKNNGDNKIHRSKNNSRNNSLDFNLRGKISNRFTEENVDPVKKIIFIWTQMRSGSSFTSAILSNIPGTFTTIEPIRTKIGHKSPEKYFTGIFFKDYLVRLMQCKIDFDAAFPIFYPKDYCLREKFSGYLCASKEFSEYFCSKSRIHLLKIVSLRLKLAQSLLEEELNFDIRIIHLVRDPRGMLSSSKGIIVNDNLLDPEYICENLREDIAVGQQISKNYPNRYKLVRYEDLAALPVSFTKEMLNFLQERPTIKVLTALNKLTNSFSVVLNTAKYSVTKYSKSKPNEWRKYLNFSEVMNIQNVCGDVIAQLKYRLFSDENEYVDYTMNS
ncbi:carbohydrate sulfotransferase 5-like [Hyalella azteca]|uniref:Carbohydrate sulfotransferase 5-like n=1 Tax=Hyalella azteca TaxID=294128 RepID=A0A979FNV2_HYAAZ|nr:carbohydrate sulfotransferase 5-like [Hyalella azteca]